MPASKFLKIVKKPAKFQVAVSMCQFLSHGTTLYRDVSSCPPENHSAATADDTNFTEPSSWLSVIFPFFLRGRKPNLVT